MNRFIIVSADPDAPPLRAKAEALAADLGLPLAPSSVGQSHCGAGILPASLLLVVTAERLELRDAASPKAGALYVDFVGGPVGRRRRAGALAGQMLARAVGFKGKRLTVCDATAGLGRDAFLLACLGCHVTAVERSPVVAALLSDGLARATADAATAKAIGGRLHLVHGDARDVLRRLSTGERPDVVYLDPMFPARRKAALVKKELRMCRLVAGDDPDAAELLAIATGVARTRVVVKRALHAPTLGGKPSFAYRGTTVRYDVYVPLNDGTCSTGTRPAGSGR